MKRSPVVLLLLALICTTQLTTAHAQTTPVNGNFLLVGENGSPVTLIGSANSFTESAAKYWDQIVAVGNTSITTELMPSTLPQGANMIHVTTNGGLNNSLHFGNGLYWAHGIPGSFIPANTLVSFDLRVVSGTITGGLIQTNGAFFDFTPHGATSNWAHIVQQYNAPAVGISFENLSQSSGAEFYLANVYVASAVPEPDTFALLFTCLGILSIYWRRSNRRTRPGFSSPV